MKIIIDKNGNKIGYLEECGGKCPKGFSVEDENDHITPYPWEQ